MPIDLGAIAIRAVNNLLNAVEITGDKSIYESSIDRKIYNVGKDLMSQSGSVSEILDNIPSVSMVFYQIQCTFVPGSRMKRHIQFL